jgi:ubiquinone biosynthesis monooxygenase Coq7
VARILKVNHAGEFGAIRIYRAQIAVARLLYPDAVAFLEQTLGHEIAHCASFLDAMPARAARPCRIMALWGNGGYALGLLTALAGRQGIWICTAAVEATVHRHLEDQLRFLADRDPGLHDLIRTIRKDELAHLRYATEHLSPSGLWARLLDRAICGATEAVIWLSTWGDSTRMARDLRG